MHHFFFFCNVVSICPKGDFKVLLLLITATTVTATVTSTTTSTTAAAAVPGATTATVESLSKLAFTCVCPSVHTTLLHVTYIES